MSNENIQTREKSVSAKLFRAGRALLTPLLVFITTPFVLAHTLWNCRVLMAGRWEDHVHFSLDRAMWSLCYRFWDEALQKTGRYGYTEVLFPRPEPNTTLFMYPLLGLRLNHALGALAFPLGMSIWWASHALYIQQYPEWRVLAVMGILLCSSSFYGLCFGATNYHVLAFMLFPTALYGLVAGQPLMAVFVLLATVPLSPQVTFLAGLVLGWWALSARTCMPVAVYIPAAVLALGMYLFPLWRQGILKDKLSRVVGYLFHSEPRQFAQAERPSPLFWNYVVLYGQFAVVCFFFSSAEPFRFVGFFPLLFIVLNTFVRVTDLQNLVQMNLAVSAALSISSASGWVLVSFVVLACPAARYVVFHNFHGVDVRVPALAPVDMRPVFEKLDAFFAPVPDGSHVYAAYEHPGALLCDRGILSWYRNHFAANGPYSGYIENLFIYALWRRDISMSPTTTMVTYDAETREKCWGRDPSSMRGAMNAIQTRYCMHYVKAQEAFDTDAFEKAGLRVVNTLDAAALVGESPAGSPFNAGLRWYLLLLEELPVDSCAVTAVSAEG
jgi:hypothetical protein